MEPTPEQIKKLKQQKQKAVDSGAIIEKNGNS
jgi:hypothetical protein